MSDYKERGKNSRDGRNKSERGRRKNESEKGLIAKRKSKSKENSKDVRDKGWTPSVRRSNEKRKMPREKSNNRN